jgi:hypothetical protein
LGREARKDKETVEVGVAVRRPDKELSQDRRAAVRSYHLEKDARQLRALIAEVDADLAGAIDAEPRRRVQLLLGEFVSLFVTKGTPDHRISLDVHVKPDTVRLETWDAADDAPLAFWREIGESPVVFFADSWGPDRRRSSGAWFEVSRVDARAT